MPAYVADRLVCAAIPLTLRGVFLCLAVTAAGSALAVPNAAQITATVIPVPPPRPANVAEPAKPDRNTQLATSEVPTPPPRPRDLVQPAPAVASPKPETVAEESACQQRLVKLGVRFEPLPAIADGQCGAPHPVRVSHLPDSFEVTPPATLTCRVVETLSRWAKEVVAVEAARHLEALPTRIAIGTSYECRNQNRQASGKLSEHAFANAIDISGFEFKSRKAVQIGDHPADTPDALFQAAVRTQACPYFTTVLGPGSDAAHATHLHFDLRERKRGYRLCQ
jgi:hypothetical protein